MTASFNSFINTHFKISWVFLIIGLLMGSVYALALLGYTLPFEMLSPERVRSMHISLMLYGFVPLMLSILPFALFEKDGVLTPKSLSYLQLYFWLWYLFLAVMILTLALGIRRELAFYDFAYSLNFILAISGVFYIMAFFSAIKTYTVLPQWLKITKIILIIAPILLLVLMNPDFGQVEKTVLGPHGDNTLGMSFGLIPVFYLIIKLLADKPFKTTGHIFWIIPLGGYILSLVLRNFRGELSYNEEWVFQWLTFCYLPLLYIWMKNAGLTFKQAPALWIAIIAYWVIDVEGNIIFIPELRWLFHRNDLVVGHAHIAVAISLFFMALAIVSRYVDIARDLAFFKKYITLFSIMAIALSISGFAQAGLIDMNIQFFWWIRMLVGALIVILAIIMIVPKLNISYFKKNFLASYHTVGFASDGLGGLLLILTASTLYPLLGFSFDGVYAYVVFAFVTTTGMVHLFALLTPKYANLLGFVTTFYRFAGGVLFFTLFVANRLSYEALLIALYDVTFALLFLQWHWQQHYLSQKKDKS